MDSFSTQSVNWTSFSAWTLNGLAANSLGQLTIDPRWFGQVSPGMENGYGKPLGGYGDGAGYVAASLAAQQVKSQFSFANPFRSVPGYGSAPGGYTTGQGEYAGAALVDFAAGTAQSPDFALSAVPLVWLGQVFWNATVPVGTKLSVAVSYDQGNTWKAPVNGCWWPGMIQNAPLGASTIRFLVTMSTLNAGSSPVLSNVGAYVVGKTIGPATTTALPSITNPLPAKSLADFTALLQSLLPPSWFSSPSPVLSALLMALAMPLWLCYQLIVALQTQTRLATASGEMLDIAAYDFLGLNFARVANETDASFSGRLRRALFQPATTRGAIKAAVESVTQRKVSVKEVTQAMDTGGYGGGCGYAVGGLWGSTLHPYTVLVDVLRPLQNNLPAIPGYGDPQLAYGVPSQGAYFDINLSNLGNDALIYAAVNQAKAAGIQAFVRIQTEPQQRGPFV